MDPTSSPTPSPAVPVAGTESLDGVLASLAGLTLLLTLLALCAGLFFAWKYHNRVLEVFSGALSLGARQIVGRDAQAIGGPVNGGDRDAGEGAAVVGPSSLETGKKGSFEVVPPVQGNVTWAADGAVSESFSGEKFVCRFESAGSREVKATTDAGDAITPRKVDVTDAPSTANAGIVLPFAIGNWARFVVATLGVGVIGSLILAKVLDAAVGVGVLGTLLGVGVANGASASQDKVSPPAS